MRKLAVVVFLVSSLWMVSAIAEEATKLREEISVPVDYQGRQIQLTGWFEKPATAGPFASPLQSEVAPTQRLWPRLTNSAK
jgi:hypothetical protein